MKDFNLIGKCTNCGDTCYAQDLCDNCDTDLQYVYCKECEDKLSIEKFDTAPEYCIEHIPLDCLLELCENEKNPEVLWRALRRFHHSLKVELERRKGEVRK